MWNLFLPLNPLTFRSLVQGGNWTFFNSRHFPCSDSLWVSSKKTCKRIHSLVWNDTYSNTNLTSCLLVCYNNTITELKNNHTLIKTSGEDVDDEEFTITILFNQFVKSEVSHNLPIEEINKKAQVLQTYFFLNGY